MPEELAAWNEHLVGLFLKRLCDQVVHSITVCFQLIRLVEIIKLSSQILMPYCVVFSGYTQCIGFKYEKTQSSHITHHELIYVNVSIFLLCFR